jgi:HD-like signal output (HDOD) protein
MKALLIGGPHSGRMVTVRDDLRSLDIPMPPDHITCIDKDEPISEELLDRWQYESAMYRRVRDHVFVYEEATRIPNETARCLHDETLANGISELLNNQEKEINALRKKNKDLEKKNTLNAQLVDQMKKSLKVIAKFTMDHHLWAQGEGKIWK